MQFYPCQKQNDFQDSEHSKDCEHSKDFKHFQDCEHSSHLQGCEQGELLPWFQEERSGEGQGKGFLSHSSFFSFCHLTRSGERQRGGF